MANLANLNPSGLAAYSPKSDMHDSHQGEATPGRKDGFKA